MKQKIVAFFKFLISSKRGYLIIILVVTSLVGSYSFLIKKSPANVNLASNLQKENLKPQLNQPKATTDINKEFEFSLKNDAGREEGKIIYTLETADLRNEIIIKGQKATAVSGKEFLIINLKIKNDQNKEVTINSRDYIRLSAKDNTGWIAPDIHNDPVVVQPISTKYTRLGFAVDEINKSFKLQIGEINKDKTIVDLLFN